MTSGNLDRRRTRLAFHFCTATICMTSLSGCAFAPKEPLLSPEQRQLNVAAFDDVWTTIRDTHWDPDLGGLDWEALREQYRPCVKSAEHMSEARAAMSDWIAQLQQTHFSILPEDLLDDIDTAEGEGQRDGGTGIDVRVVDGQALVTTVDEGSPALAVGIKPGWIVVRSRLLALLSAARQQSDAAVRAPDGHGDVLPPPDHHPFEDRLAAVGVLLLHLSGSSARSRPLSAARRPPGPGRSASKRGETVLSHPCDNQKGPPAYSRLNRLFSLSTRPSVSTIRCSPV